MQKALELTSKELRRLQLTQLEMLHELHRICDENNIKYILDAGTLLGAIRHGGFIPWDDDIDIRMLRSEYEKLCIVLEKKEENKMFFFQNYKSDKNYYWQYSRLLKRGTRYVRLGKEHLKQKDGVYLDIFVCDGVPKSKTIRKIHNLIMKFCRKSMYAKVAYITEKNRTKKLIYSMLRYIPKSFVFFLYGTVAKIFNEDNCERFGSYGWHAEKDNQGFLKKWFTELDLVEFEDGEFLAPKDFQGFLAYSFGEDYMELPSADQRIAKAFTSYYEF